MRGHTVGSSKPIRWACTGTGIVFGLGRRNFHGLLLVRGRLSSCGASEFLAKPGFAFSKLAPIIGSFLNGLPQRIVILPG